MRVQGRTLLLVLVLLVAGINAPATHAVDPLVEVPGELGSIPARSVPDSGLMLKSNSTAHANVLHITLPQPPARQRSSSPGGVVEVGFHRHMPEEYQADLTPRLRFRPAGQGAIAAQVRVTSTGATDMRVGVLVDLPPGGEIRFFGTDEWQQYPVLTRQDIDYEGNRPLLRWSPVVDGDTIGIEIVLRSEESRDSLGFEIDRVSHGFSTSGWLKSHATSLRQASCSAGPHVDCVVMRQGFHLHTGTYRAVANIRIESNGASKDCTGTLVADQDTQSAVPYLLTAHHCVGNAAEAKSVTTRWKDMEWCPDVPEHRDWEQRYSVTNYGTDLLATSSAQDSTLLRYRRLLPTTRPFSYSGWTTASVASGTPVYGLHHPLGGVMRYSRGTKTGDEDVFLTDERILVRNAHRVTWSEGRTLPGSSGSGLWRLDGDEGRPGYLVGVLSGGSNNPCRNTYGSFRDFFPHASRWLNATTAPVIPPPAPSDVHSDHLSHGPTSVSRISRTDGRIHPGGDRDYFRLEFPSIPGGGRYLVRVYTEGDVDTYGTLFDGRERGFQRLNEDNDSGNGRNFSFDINLEIPPDRPDEATTTVDPEPIVHFIEVRGATRATLGPYRLVVMQLLPEIETEDVDILSTDDHGNTPDTATLVAVPSSISGDIGVGGDVDFFRIDVKATRPLRVHTAGGTDTYGTLTKEGAVVTENDDGGDGGNFSFTQDVRPGTYFVVVRGFDQDTTGRYSLMVEYEEAVHILPFIISADDRVRSSFILVRNRSDEDGEVSIYAVDDTGERFGPAILEVTAGRTASFNSYDLEAGNTNKNLAPGIGDGTGHWRVELATDLDIEARAYIRTVDGFVTSMHELAREQEGMKGRYVVPFFNPASNTTVVSRIRVANPNAVTVDVTLEAWDSRGEAAEDVVEFSIEAGAAVLISSQQLEVGDADVFSGRLGDGAGKWRFEVSGGGLPLEVMSLLSTGSGHLTNLSR